MDVRNIISSSSSSYGGYKNASSSSDRQDRDAGDDDDDDGNIDDNGNRRLFLCSAVNTSSLSSKNNANATHMEFEDAFLSLDEVRFYLEWFVASYNANSNSMIQLGRNKPDFEHGSSGNNLGLERSSNADIDVTASCSSSTATVTTSTSTDANNVRVSPTFGFLTTADTNLNAVVSIRNSRLAAAVRNATAQDVRGPPAETGPSANVLVTIPLTPNEFILREIADIRRLLLQRFLMQGGGGNNLLEPTMLDAAIETDNELFDILGVLTDVDGVAGVSLLDGGVGAPGEPTPHFPVGEWVWTECEICLDYQWLYRRACCGFPSCGDCMKRYFTTKVTDGIVKIECCSPKCRRYVHRDEISARLDGQAKHRFYQFLVQANADPYVKTCPGCNHITRFVTPGGGKQKVKNTKKHPERCRVVCSECCLTWCFLCHAPWHDSLTCRQYRKGDRLLRSWAHEVQHGQLNAQKCPKCQVYIQRTTGCDHMHCTRCKTDFCYRCGDRLRKLRFFGDHYSKLSIFGCKYRYKADKPLQRKLIRGAVFGGKLMVAPILGTLGACAGAIALGFGIFILPVYGGVRLYQRFGTNKHPHFPPRFPLPQPMFHFGNEIPAMAAVDVHHNHNAASGVMNNHNRVNAGASGNGGTNHRPLEPRSPQWVI